MCPECENGYKSIGHHWRYNPSHRPDFTQHQKEIITGLLMGDGHLNPHNKNPYIECSMISENYLNYVDEKFGKLGLGVSLKCSAKDSANYTESSQFSSSPKEKDYSNVYRWRSSSHPKLKEFNEWYSTGTKVWPEDIKLTPTVLKHWYCGDGSWSNSQYKNHISISMSNERKNLNKIDQMFKNVGLPSPNNYTICRRIDNSKSCTAEFTVEQSKKLWEYMGKPLPDFEYKWPEKYH